jgi:FkbM family methyltransferase
VFPEAKYILVEPLEEYEPFLNRVLKTIPGAELVQVAAAQGRGDVVIHVHPDLVGSSVYLEQEDSTVNGVPRTVPALSLDEITRERNLEAPYLVKIDVQGAELDVLEGGEEALKKTDYLLLEVSLFGFFKGGPQLYDVTTFMKSRGFVIYEILGLQYRPLDNALSQVDLAFVKETGLFRDYHYYASSKQREEQNKRFKVRLTQRARMLGRK